MYEQYNEGFSLAEVGKMFGVTRQTVYDRFRRRKFKLREKKYLPFVLFNGDKFTRGRYGYYRKTYGDRDALHRVVWKFHKGDIPKGHEVHHKDADNFCTTDISRLECLTKADHGRLESIGINQFTPLDIKTEKIKQHRERKSA